MKKDSFLKGTLVASVAIIITKVLGVLYVIPFYNIIGEQGGVLYAYAYNIYNLFLNVSIAGIPIAISMIISEYIALNKLDAKERVYSVSRKLIITFSIITFLIVFVFSDYFALFYIDGVTGGNSIKNISLVIKAISISLLIVPFLSVLRGYLQGHKYIAPGSMSQVYEQVIRIAVVLLGSYLAINIFNTSIPIGVSVALTGAFFGGLGAYLYLKLKIKRNRELFVSEKPVKKDSETNKHILKKVVLYSIPLILIAITNDIYTIVDMKLIIKGLYMIGYDADTCELISSIIATWAPKICMLIMAISMGLVTSLIPHIIEKYTKKDYKSANQIFNQAVSTMLIVALPMMLGIIVLSTDVYSVFYGPSKYGPNILIITTFVTLAISVLSIANTTLQGFKKFVVVILSTLTGLVINALLDIPMILLLNKIGFTPYFGTSIASVIGAVISITIILAYLKKNYNFKYFEILKNTSKTFIPLILMCIVVVPLDMLIDVNANRFLAVLKILLIAVVGAILYALALYKNKGVEDVFGKEATNKILKKLHLKK